MKTRLQRADTVWSHSVFRKMFAAYSISSLGDWFDMMGVIVWLAYVWRASPLVIALIPFAYGLPGFVFGQFAGVLVDRSKKLPLMIGSDLIAGVLTALLLVAPNLASILLLLTLRACTGVVSTISQQALTRQVVAEEQLLQATTWNNLVGQMMKILGPMLGGSLMSFLSPKFCLALNAASFLASALFLLTIRQFKELRKTSEPQPTENTPPQKSNWRQAWREGWAVIGQNRLLLGTLIYSTLGLLAVQLLDFQGAVLFRQFAPADGRLPGWCVAASGLGAVLVITWLNRRKRLPAYGWLFGTGYLLIGLGFAAQGLLQPGMSDVWPIGAGLVVGVGNGLFFGGFSYLLQKEPPEESIGRVSGIFNSTGSVVFLVAPLTGGWLVARFGAFVMFQQVGLVIGGLGLIGLVFGALIWRTRAVSRKTAIPERIAE